MQNKRTTTKKLQPANGKTSIDRKTTQQVMKYCINKEIKYLENKEQHLKIILYQLHIKGAEYHTDTWQHALLQIDETLNKALKKIGICKQNKNIKNKTQMAQNQTKILITTRNQNPEL